VRTAYIGTSPFAASVLESLAASRHRPALVLTRPPRPRGRGRRLSPTPVAERAGELGIGLLEPERLGDAAAEIAAASPEVLCVCAYGALVREPILSSYEILNVHPSALPRWRGAAPVERAIIAGDAETGVSIMRLVAELDAGPVCAYEATTIEPQDDFGTLAARLAAIAARLLIASLDGRACSPSSRAMSAMRRRSPPPIGSSTHPHAGRARACRSSAASAHRRPHAGRARRPGGAPRGDGGPAGWARATRRPAVVRCARRQPRAAARHASRRTGDGCRRLRARP